MVNLFSLSSPEENVSDLYILNLTSFSSGDLVHNTLQSLFHSLREGRVTVLMILIDIKTSKSSQINFVRHEIDFFQKEIKGNYRLFTSLILSIPSECISLRSYYHSIFLNNWEYLFVDSFEEDEGSMEPLNLTIDPDVYTVDLTDEEEVGREKESRGLFDVTEGRLREESDRDILPEQSDENRLEIPDDESPQSSIQDGACDPSTIVMVDPTKPKSWIRVAWGLAELPKLEDVYTSFGGSQIETALHSAIRDIKFSYVKQSTLQSICPKSCIVYSRDPKRYAWITDTLSRRPYFIHCILEKFLFLWASVLERTVKTSCHQISLGQAVGSVLSSVKASQHWILHDFFRYLLSSHLFVDFGLETLATLPEGELSHHLRTTKGDFVLHDYFDRSPAAESLRAEFFVLLMKALPSPLSDDLSVLPSSSVNVSNMTPRASILPLFGTLMKMLDKFFIAILRITPQPEEAIQISFDILKNGSHPSHSLSEVEFPPDFLKCLGLCVSAIDNNPPLFYDWLCDYFVLTLGMNIKSDFERDVVITMALEILLKEKPESPLITLRLKKQQDICEIGNNILSSIRPLAGILDRQFLTNFCHLSGRYGGDIYKGTQNEGIRYLWAYLNQIGKSLNVKESMKTWISAMREYWNSGFLQSGKTTYHHIEDPSLQMDAIKMICVFLTFGHLEQKDPGVFLCDIASFLEMKFPNNIIVGLLNCLQVIGNIFQIVPRVVLLVTEDIVRWSLSLFMEQGIPEHLILALANIPLPPAAHPGFTPIFSLPLSVRKAFLLHLGVMRERKSLDIINEGIMANVTSHINFSLPFFPPEILECSTESTRQFVSAPLRPILNLSPNLVQLLTFLYHIICEVENTSAILDIAGFYCRAIANRSSAYALGCVYVTAYSALLLQKISEKLSAEPESTFDEEILNQVRSIIADQPIVWGPYFLSRLKGMELKKNILSNKEFLTSFGLTEWFVTPNQIESQLNVGPSKSNVKLPFFPFMVCPEDPLFNAYRTLLGVLKDGAVTMEDFIGWASAQLNSVWVARGMLILALYYTVWAHNRKCPAVIEWARSIKQNTGNFPQTARLNVTSREAEAYLFFSSGPLPPVVSHPSARTSHMASLFSLQSLESETEMERDGVMASRANFVSALAAILGSPPHRLYYYTPLFNPTAIARGETKGLGSGHGGLAKDCGYRFAMASNSAFDDASPDVPPFNNETLPRLINNALIYIAHSWNTIFFDESQVLKGAVFSYWNTDLPFPHPEQHSRLCCVIYASNRATTFLNAFLSHFSAVNPNMEALYAWGCVLQATWMASLDVQGEPSLRAIYQNEQNLRLDTMNTFRRRWAAAFLQENRIKEAIGDLIGMEFKKRVQALEESRAHSLTIRMYPEITMDLFWKQIEDPKTSQKGTLFEKKAARLISYLFRERQVALTLSTHIPVIHYLYQFASVELAYRLTAEELDMPLERAFALHLTRDRQSFGKRMIEEFRRSWGILADAFLTFNQCRQELEQNSEIPRLLGDELTVRTVVTPPDFDPKLEDDPCPLIRLLKTRLIANQNGALMIFDEWLRSAEKDELTEKFNQYEWIFEDAVDEMKLSQLPKTAAIYKKLLTLGGDGRFRKDDDTTALFEDVCLSSYGLINGQFQFNLFPIVRYLCAKYISGRPPLSVDSIRFYVRETFDLRPEDTQRHTRDDIRRQNEVVSEKRNQSTNRLSFLLGRFRALFPPDILTVSLEEKRGVETHLLQTTFESEDSLLLDLIEIVRMAIVELEHMSVDERIQSCSADLTHTSEMAITRSVNIHALCRPFRLIHLPLLVEVCLNSVNSRPFAKEKYLNAPLPDSVELLLSRFLVENEDRIEDLVGWMSQFARDLYDCLEYFGEVPLTTPLLKIPRLVQIGRKDPILAFQILQLPDLRVEHVGQLLRLFQGSIAHMNEKVISNISIPTGTRFNHNIPNIYEEKVVAFQEEQVVPLQPDTPAVYLEIMRKDKERKAEAEAKRNEELERARRDEKGKEEETHQDRMQTTGSIDLGSSSYMGASVDTPESAPIDPVDILLKGAVSTAPSTPIAVRRRFAESVVKPSAPSSLGPKRIPFDDPSITKTGITMEDLLELGKRNLLHITTPLGKHRVSLESWEALPTHCLRYSDFVESLMKSHPEPLTALEEDWMMQNVKTTPIFVAKVKKLYTLCLKEDKSPCEYIIREDLQGFQYTEQTVSKDDLLKKSSLSPEDFDYLVSRKVLKTKVKLTRLLVTKMSWEILPSLSLSLRDSASVSLEQQDLKSSEENVEKAMNIIRGVFAQQENRKLFQISFDGTPPQEYLLMVDLNELKFPLRETFELENYFRCDDDVIKQSGLILPDLNYFIENGHLKSIQRNDVRFIEKESWQSLSSHLIVFEQFLIEENLQEYNTDDIFSEVKKRAKSFLFRPQDAEKEAIYFLRSELSQIQFKRPDDFKTDFQRKHHFSDEDMRYLETHVFNRMDGDDMENFFMTDMISLASVGNQYGFPVEDLIEGLNDNATIRFFTLEDFGPSDADVVANRDFRVGSSPNSKYFVSLTLISLALGDS